MKKVLSVVGIVLVAILYISTLVAGPKQADASVSIGSGYLFKVATTSQASAVTPFIVRGGSGILGSMIISSSTDVRVRIYDNNVATSTVATSTLIADFPANTTAGVYTFDVNVTRGIAVDLPATYKGVITFTYR